MNTRTVKKYYATRRRNRALLIALGGHVIIIIVIAIYFLKSPIDQTEDGFIVDFVSPTQLIRQQKKRTIDVPQSKPSGAIQNLPPQSPSARISPIPKMKVQPSIEAPAPVDSTVADLAPSAKAILDFNSPRIERGSGATDVTGDTRTGGDIGRRGNRPGAGLGNVTQSGNTGEDAFGDGVSDIVNSGGGDTEAGLGSRIDEEDGIIRGHISLIRLKHAMSDWWQDPTAIPSLIAWLREHRPTITADMKYAEGTLSLTDADIMNAPLLIMTGHDQAMSVSYKQLVDRNSQASGFSDAERAALRKYILDYKGMLFFDYCGDGGNEKSFARLIETELRTVFPEYPLTTLDVRHEIFQCYFKLKKTPVGGSSFWGTGYKGGNVNWRRIKGISVPGRLGKDRLAVVFCPLDYLCSMETAEVDSRARLASRRSSDVYRFMTNMFVYQMRQRAGSK